MTLTVNLDGVRDAYRLCFVRSPWAYFTRLPLDLQWGNRWELTPCDAHTGAPYNDRPDQILKVAFDGPLFTPDQGRDGRALSVLEINRGEAPWLRTENFFGGPPMHIPAGATLDTFLESVELAGGHVFAPLGWGDLAIEPASQSSHP
jgi:hypothetical protein